MATIGQVLVKIGADISGLDKAVKGIGDKLEKALGSEAMSLSKGLVAGLGGLAAAFGVAGTAGVKMAADLEQSKIAFTTLLGSAEKAEAFLKELSTFAARTPFELPGLQDASRKLLAFGFQAEQIIPMMTAIGDAVSGLGGGAAEIDRVTYALGQMQAKGKVSAEEMNQLAELGIPAWAMLAEKIGVSIPEAMKMAERGAISASVAIPAILAGMNDKFGGMMEKQSKSLLGMWSTAKDSIGAALRTLGQQIIDTFNLDEKLAGLVEWLTRFADLLGEKGIGGALEEMIPDHVEATIVIVAGAIMGAMVPALIAMAVAAWAAVVPLLPFIAAGAAIAALAFLIWKNWEPIANFFKNVWTAIVTFVTNAWNGLVNFFKEYGLKLVTTIMEPIIWLASLISKVWDQIKAFTVGVWNAIVGFFKGLWEAIVNGFKNFAQNIVNAFIWLYEHNYYFEALVNFIVEAFNWLKSTASAVWNAITSFLTTAWETISNTATSIWQAIAGFFTGLWNGIKNTAAAIFDAVAGVVLGVWERIKTGTVNAWNGLVGFLRGLWNTIVEAISTPFNRAKEFITNLASQALAWGKNLISEFVKGIWAKIGDVINAAKGIANKVKSFLGFHSPTKEGPGSEADVWGPNLAKTFAEGIIRNVPVVQNAMAQLMSPVAMAMAPTVSAAIPGGPAIPVAGGAPGYGGAGDTGPLVHVQNLYVRDDSDIQAISRELYSLHRAKSRARGQ